MLEFDGIASLMLAEHSADCEGGMKSASFRPSVSQVMTAFIVRPHQLRGRQ